MEHYHVAQLKPNELEKIKGLEEELNVVLIAYGEEDNHKQTEKHPSTS
ncbi:uroporphyrinogen-III decarboxylase [Alkalihalobacillus sp. LMS39]|nr:uroporphyrinogen-III decarboxylase [Alkalihalobacillus sp. LMS39]UOE96032.1 uroporphyrinogen-III decarboxylase [Alkalihalobacillus sp. LMS39]